MLTHTVLEGRRPGGEWGVIDNMKQENSTASRGSRERDRFQQGSVARLHAFQNQAMDGAGYFYNWDFRLREV